MRFYEITYLISPDVSEEEVKSIQEKITSLVRGGGILINNPFFQKRALACPIKKRHWAVFGTFSFQIKPEGLPEFEKKLRSEPRIIRYLLTRKDERKKGSEIPRPSAFKKKSKSPKREKVELKEIDKKLEEILGK